MNIDRLLAFIVVGMTALLIGGIGGLLIGATTEQAALAEILGTADLTADCRAQIEEAMAGGRRPTEGP
ncbi:hypothetical protein AUC69_05115 [Methyloceanibacter superfactus]|uniref:Uncharacterized protein n=1 Tax=Methyloceanibacter superfactus TaxID=1774969 RepID=A0A1E3W836_9HYPH|nr:hypothetical protein [Methyloceanibacter superfactus]ODS01652.1 hypothetical protein AUC69_05115 [Methyloceanibacter superfactus]